MKTSLALLLVLVASCQPAPSADDTSAEAALGSSPQPAAAPAPDRYVDVEDYLANGDDTAFTAWIGLRDTLKANFDDVCGDTFCEGDYSNLEPIRLRCSMDATSLELKSCKYVFAGSYETINAQTGSIKVNAKTFSCAVAVTGLTLADFTSTLTATGTDAPLRRAFANGTRSIYDSLGGCL